MKALKFILIFSLLISSTVFSQVIDDLGGIPSQKQEVKKVKVKKENPSADAAYNDNTANLHIRHLKGMKCMDIQYGWAQYGTFANLGYGQLLTDNLLLNFHLNYEYGIIGQSMYDYKNVKIGLCHTVAKLKNAVFFNLAYGGILGAVEGQNKDLGYNERKFNAGLYAGGNIEMYLFNRFSLLAIAEQQYNFMDKFGTMHFNLGGGIRIYIY